MAVGVLMAWDYNMVHAVVRTGSWHLNQGRLIHKDPQLWKSFSRISFRCDLGHYLRGAASLDRMCSMVETRRVD